MSLMVRTEEPGRCLLVGVSRNRCSIFESSDRLGGLWPLHPNISKTEDNSRRHDVVRPNMRTNLSKYTVGFSDLAWRSGVDLDSGSIDGSVAAATDAKGDEFVGMFPRAWQVGRYLKKYAEKYIPDEVISLNSRVTRIEKAVDEAGGWLVSWSKQRIDCSDVGEPDTLMDNSQLL